ncbi:MAG TPA: MFS transporter, partial [Acidimicrobiales bacterium]|nr:MFS transporter [Acidimicrobiales bacterium]
HPGMRAGATIVTGIFFAAFGTQFVMTQWIQGPLRHGPLAAGLCFVPFALAGSIAATRNPAGARRFGHRTVIVAGMALMGAAVMLASLAVSTHQLVLAVLALALIGAGQGLALPSGVELIMTSVPAEQAGSAAGVHETIVEAGGAIGVAVLGSALADGAGFSAPLLLGAGAVIIAGAIAGGLLRGDAYGAMLSPDRQASGRPRPVPEP